MLAPWMRWLLRFVAVYNVLAGVLMLVFYHESYKTMGVAKPDSSLPLQMVGLMVALFGVGYALVSFRPMENRNVLALGFWSKFLGSILGLSYVALGKLPASFLILLFVSDIVYLPPFWIILRRLKAASGERRPEPRVLDGWMTALLWIAAAFNLAVGLPMIVAFRACYGWLGLATPELHLPMQLLGVLVVLFGVGYALVAARPIENRNLLVLGWWGKALVVVLGVYHFLSGQLASPAAGAILLADFLFLFPFAAILKRLRAA